MAHPTTAPAPDKRLKLLDAAVRKHGGRPDGLVEVLHRAQELYGFLDSAVLWHVTRALRLPPSRVYGVATFYHLFRLKPPGAHTCVVCLGTACFVRGAEKLVAAAEACGLKPGTTSAGGRVSLGTARCFGTCGIAPAVEFDGEIDGRVTPDRLAERLKRWAADGPG